MRRILSWIAIVTIAAAFVLLCLVLPLKINITIPIALFAVAIVLFFVVKRMPSDLPEEEEKPKSEWKRVDSDEAGEERK